MSVPFMICFPLGDLFSKGGMSVSRAWPQGNGRSRSVMTPCQHLNHLLARLGNMNEVEALKQKSLLWRCSAAAPPTCTLSHGAPGKHSTPRLCLRVSRRAMRAHARMTPAMQPLCRQTRLRSAVMLLRPPAETRGTAAYTSFGSPRTCRTG